MSLDRARKRLKRVIGPVASQRREPCEPCSFKGDDQPSTSVTGWDFTPVCDWHREHSWSSRAPQHKSTVDLSRPTLPPPETDTPETADSPAAGRGSVKG